MHREHWNVAEKLSIKGLTKLLQSAERFFFLIFFPDSFFCRYRTNRSFVRPPMLCADQTTWILQGRYVTQYISFTCLVWNKVRASACFHGDTVKTTKSNVTRDHKSAHSNSHHCTEQVFPHQKGGVRQYREERPLSYRTTSASVTPLQYCLTSPTLPWLTVQQYCSLARNGHPLNWPHTHPYRLHSLPRRFGREKFVMWHRSVQWWQLLWASLVHLSNPPTWGASQMTIVTSATIPWEEEFC